MNVDLKSTEDLLQAMIYFVTHGCKSDEDRDLCKRIDAELVKRAVPKWWHI